MHQQKNSIFSADIDWVSWGKYGKKNKTKHFSK
jgi:hypothetical protein